MAAATALAGGRGALIVVPDHRDVDRVDRGADARSSGKGRHVRLTADQGPQARYTAWLKVLRGHVRCVVGTRAAAFAPVRDLGLVAWWDDGDDLLHEPRAPYPHAGVVLGIRAGLEDAALLAGGFARSVEVAQLVESAALADVRASHDGIREAAPGVVIAGEGSDAERDGAAARAHLPPAAWRAAKAGLEKGPVLVQVPRRGYLPSLSCDTCREPVRCARCHGPVALASAEAAPQCRWCETVFAMRDFDCPSCGGGRVRAGVVGARRTAEEIGRAFPGALVVHVRHGPGARVRTGTAGPRHRHPRRRAGRRGRVCRDRAAPRRVGPAGPARSWTHRSRRCDDGRAAAALTRPGAEGGVVVLAGAPSRATLPAVEALVRWDPAWLAARELAERVALGLPPAVPDGVVGWAVAAPSRPRWPTSTPPWRPSGWGRCRFVLRPEAGQGPAGHRRPEGLQLLPPRARRRAWSARTRPATTGRAAADAGSRTPGGSAGVPDGRRAGASPARARPAMARGSPVAARSAETLDAPSPTPDGSVQVLLRVPLERAPALAAALVALRATRSARKDPEPLAIRMDAVDRL